MSLLAKLVAEWYGYYHRCAVWANVKYGLLPSGGHKGELEVVAFNPWTRVLTHVETYPDSSSWDEQLLLVAKRFQETKSSLCELFAFDIARVDRVSVVAALPPPGPVALLPGIEVKTVPEFLATISSALVALHPERATIPDSYPMLRALQLGVHYGFPSRPNLD